MTPGQYNWEKEMERRANMKPWEVIQEMSPKMQAIVQRWAEEDAKEPTTPTRVDGE